MSTERSGVLSDKSKAESGSHPMSGCAAACESFENALSFMRCDTGPVVVDDDGDRGWVITRGHPHSDRASGMNLSVMQQVADDAFKAHSVNAHRNSRPKIAADVDAVFWSLAATALCGTA